MVISHAATRRAEVAAAASDVEAFYCHGVTGHHVEDTELRWWKALHGEQIWSRAVDRDVFVNHKLATG